MEPLLNGDTFNFLNLSDGINFSAILSMENAKIRFVPMPKTPHKVKYNMQRYFQLILVFLMLFTANTNAQLNTDNIFNKGRSAIHFDDYAEAINKFNEIIRVKPYLPEPYFFRGLAKSYLEDFNGALTDYTKAIELNPNYTFAYLYRGIAKQNLKDFYGALDDLNAALELKPNNADIYFSIANCQASLNKFKEAEKNYAEAIHIDPKHMGAYLNRALVRDNQGDIDGAIKDCSKAIQLNNFSADAYGNRGYMKFKKKEYTEAVKDYDRALKIDPENARLLMGRGFANYELKNLQASLNDYNEAIKVDPNNAHAYFNRALLKSEVGDYNSAIEDFNSVLEMNPDNMLVYFNRGFVKMDIGDIYGAIADYSTAIELYPDFAKAYLARSSAKSQINDDDGAFKDRHRGLEIIERYKKMKNQGEMAAFVDTTENFNRLIDLNSRDKYTDDIIKGRVQDKYVSIELEENFVITHSSLDRLRAGKTQYYDQSVMQYNQAQNYNPCFTISNKQRDYSKDMIKSQLEKSNKQIDVGNKKGYFHRGVYHLLDHKYNMAIEDFNKAIKANNKFLFAYFNRGNAVMAMTDYIQSIGMSDESVISLRPEEKKKKNEVIVDYSSAIKDYTRAIELNPKFAFAIYNRANAYTKSKQFKKAIADYDWALQVEPNFAEAYFNRGLVYLFLDNKELAYEDLSKAGELGLLDAYNVIKRYCNKE